MNGETWPKESQRMCNGASGKVPIAGLDQTADAGPSWLCIEWLRMPPAQVETATPVHRAIEVADCIFAESLDMAQHVIGHSASERNQVLTLATAHAAVVVKVYAAHMRAEVSRELVPEIAGAISEAGTDIGAGIALALEQALK